MNFRTKIIQRLVHINEGIFFYPKLKKFYIENLKDNKNLNILDIGANKGQSIDFFRAIYPSVKINAFEPNKKLFELLKKKYNLNKNIKIHNLGVSNVAGSLEFHENILDETSTFETLNYDSKYLAKKAKVLGVKVEDIIVDNYSVAVIRLADFLNENGNASYDVLKIDVEGHELACLQGLFMNENMSLPIRFIQLESHNDDMYLNNTKHVEIEKLLNANGFFKTAEIKHGFGDFAEIIYLNKNINET